MEIKLGLSNAACLAIATITVAYAVMCCAAVDYVKNKNKTVAENTETE